MSSEREKSWPDLTKRNLLKCVWLIPLLSPVPWYFLGKLNKELHQWHEQQGSLISTSNHFENILLNKNGNFVHAMHLARKSAESFSRDWDLQSVQTSLQELIVHDRSIHHARIINLEWKEIVRANSRLDRTIANTVITSNLQNKSERDYFLEVKNASLREWEIFMSHITLNQDHWQISDLPVVRFIERIFTDGVASEYFTIINFYPPVDDIENTFDNKVSDFFLINKNNIVISSNNESHVGRILPTDLLKNRDFVTTVVNYNIWNSHKNLPLKKDKFDTKWDSNKFIIWKWEYTWIMRTRKDLLEGRHAFFWASITAILAWAWVAFLKRRKYIEQTKAANRILWFFDNSENMQFVTNSNWIIEYTNKKVSELLSHSYKKWDVYSIDNIVKIRTQYSEILGIDVDYIEYPNWNLLPIEKIEAESNWLTLHTIIDISEKIDNEILEKKKNILIKMERDILAIAISFSYNYEQKLKAILDIILRVPWLWVQNRWSIFEKIAWDQLKMTVQTSLHPDLLTKCSRLAIWECICWTVAKLWRIIETFTVDDSHTILPDDYDRKNLGEFNHWHYCLPINWKNWLIWVLNLYKDAWASLDLEEKKLIDIAVWVLASVMSSKIQSKELYKKQLLANVDPRPAFILAKNEEVKNWPKNLTISNNQAGLEIILWLWKSEWIETAILPPDFDIDIFKVNGKDISYEKLVWGKWHVFTIKWIAEFDCAIMYWTDITNQKRAEERLVRSNEETIFILEEAPTPILTYAHSAFDEIKHKWLNRKDLYKQIWVLTVDRVNKKVLEMLGLEEKEFAWMDILNPKIIDDENAKLLFAEILWNKDKLSFSCQLSLKKKNWTSLPVRVEIKNIKNDKTGEILTSGTFMDEKALQDALYRATHDDLTDLPNRFLINNELNESIEEVNRSGYNLWVLYMDLNFLKWINTTYWHIEADEVLNKVAAIMKKHFRQTDIIWRYWWDEFVALMKNVNGESWIEAKINGFLEEISGGVTLNSWTVVPIRMSVWYDVYKWEKQGADFDADELAKVLKKNADKAMYEAKLMWKWSDLINKGDPSMEQVEGTKSAYMRFESHMQWNPGEK